MYKELSFRQLKESDYDTLVGWWKDWGWTPVKKELLPESGTGGLMVLWNDVPVCAGFVYITNSKMSWIEWVISSKNFKGKERRDAALLTLLSGLEHVAKTMGAEVAYALIKNKSLADKYEALGFIKGDTYNTEMIKTL